MTGLYYKALKNQLFPLQIGKENYYIFNNYNVIYIDG